MMYKLLIADDEYWIRENIKNMLDWNEYEIELCTPAVDGEDALNKIRQEHPHILITDVNMPFLSGVELTKKAKEICPEIVIITVSGFSDYEYVREMLTAGAIDYMLKPISKTALEDIVKKSIDIISAYRELEKEREDITKNLYHAHSLIRDHELSNLIINSEFRNNTSRVSVIDSRFISELELSFASFTLILIRLIDARIDAELIGRIKAAIEDVAQHASNSVVFNNVYSPNEFILLSSAPDTDLLCQDILDSLSFIDCKSIGISVSRQYFSFSQMKKAYDDALLARKYGNTSNDDRSQTSTKSIIRKLIRYVDEHYSEELSLSFLSKMFLIEQSYLSRVFKQFTGENLIPYINKKRVEKAVEYINKRCYQLSEVSYFVGFDDYTYFNRVFRRIMNQSPSDYVKMLDSGNE